MAVAAAKRLLTRSESNAAARADVRAAMDENAAARRRLERATNEAQASSARTLAAIARYSRAVRERIFRKNGPER